MSYGLLDIGGQRVELCDECGFDSRKVEDVPGALAAAFGALDALQAHPDAERRPKAETWSAREYGQHAVDIAEELLRSLNDVTSENVPEPIVNLRSAAAVACRLANTLTPEQRTREASLASPPSGAPFTMLAQDVINHLLHDVEHHVLDVRRGLAVIAMTSGTEIYINHR